MSVSTEMLYDIIIRDRSIFIETGTNWGKACIQAIKMGAKCCITIENDPLWFGIAMTILGKELKEKSDDVSIIMGDSVSVLENMKDGFDVWEKVVKDYGDDDTSLDIIILLNAHSSTYSPILPELEAIKTWTHKPVVILIDDMNYMEQWGVSKSEILSRIGDIGNYTIEQKSEVLIAKK